MPVASEITSYPRPLPDPLTQFFWDGAAVGKLLIQRCGDCHRYIHWPQPVCSNCLSESLSPTEVSGRGHVYSYTVTTQPYHPGIVGILPFTLALVELEEQDALRMVSQVVQCAEADLRIGLPVEVTFREMAPGLTLPLFRPLSARQAPSQRTPSGV
jgi:uncharacterized OB-fold protein